MPETLLRTKLFIPPVRPNRVSRPQLIAALNQGLQLGNKLTLISAPAGFGKTTLVSDWVHTLPRDGANDNQQANEPAWLSLDEGDNDLNRFLTYFVAALDQTAAAESSIGTAALSMLQSPQPPPTEPILTSLINDIAAISARLVLVLDDYHLIDSAAVDGALTFLLEHLPRQLHLVIATRDDPNLPFARLRARGQLTELRALDLRFSTAEAARFLNDVMELGLPAADVATLESRTEGWIAGLQLAAMSIQGRDDTSTLIKSFTGSHRFILDYLMEEVLQQQSETIHTFLLQTAILDRLTGSICDALTGLDNGQATLEMLEHANLFLVPLDGQRLWYRYHHLFADLLRQRLRQDQPQKLPILHIKAGQWYRQQGLNREAIRHLLLAGDYEAAAELITDIAIDIMQQGEHTAVSRWITALPDEFVKEHPYLCVLHAWALQLAGQLEPAEARLKDAENRLNSANYTNTGDADTILGLIHSHRAYLAFMTGEQDQTINYARQALDRLPQSATLIRAQTALYLGVAYRYRGRLHAALEVYKDTLPLTRDMGGQSVAVLCHLHLADLYWQFAQPHRAKEFCEQALAITEKVSGRPDRPFTGFAYVRLGRIYRQWNQLQDAYQLTTKGLALCRDWNVADILALSLIELAHIATDLGEEGQAREAIQEAMQIYDGFSPWGSRYGAAHLAKIDLRRGDIAAAERWARGNDLDLDGEFEFHRENEYLALARVSLAQRRFDEAFALLARINQVAREIGKRRTELETLILLALLFAAQGEDQKAQHHLKKAVAIAEPHGYVRIFVDEGQPMAKLLREAAARGIFPHYARQLLAAFPTSETAPVELPQSLASESALIEPLSEREIEVLQLIAGGLTNQEIASRLYLSLNTVKAHTRNIYGKLDVHSRTQAVARSQELGLLS